MRALYVFFFKLKPTFFISPRLSPKPSISACTLTAIQILWNAWGFILVFKFSTLFNTFLHRWLTDCRPAGLRVWNARLHFVWLFPIKKQNSELRTVVAKLFFRCGKEKWLHWVGYTDELHKADTHSPSVLSNHLVWNFVWVEEHKLLRIRRTDLRFNGEWWLAFRLRDWEPVRTVF